MPDKYMREIEEILRNIERTEPRNDPGERIRPFARPPRRRSFSLPQLELPVTLILLGIALALVGSGLAYYQMSPTLASGLIAVAGFALFVAGLALTWWARFHGVSMPASTRSRCAAAALRGGCSASGGVILLASAPSSGAGSAGRSTGRTMCF